jgi:hypothetical protein
MSTAIRHVTPGRLALVLASMMVVVAMAYSGYSLGEAASPPSVRDYEDVMWTMDKPVDGRVTVPVDQARGVVCAQTRQGRRRRLLHQSR